jgi:hypothetical protein
MPTIQVSTEGMRRAVEVAVRARETAAADAGSALAGAFVEAHTDVSPKDTNRYANGFIDAGRKAGVTDRPLLPYQRSARHEAYVEKLEKQLEGYVKVRDTWQTWQNHYISSHRTGEPYYRKIVRRLKKAEKNVTRAIRELGRAYGSESIIFFDREAYANRRQSRSLSTVRAEPVGGRGEVVTGPHGAVTILTNMEPHAVLVNRNPNLGHPVTAAIQATRVLGLQRVSKKYVEGLKPSTLVRAA